MLSFPRLLSKVCIAFCTYLTKVKSLKYFKYWHSFTSPLVVIVSRIPSFLKNEKEFLNIRTGSYKFRLSRSRQTGN